MLYAHRRQAVQIFEESIDGFYRLRIAALEEEEVS